MVGLLINHKKTKKNNIILTLNQQILKYFKNLFNSSPRLNEKQALLYWKQVEKIGFNLLNYNNNINDVLFKIFNIQYQFPSINNSMISIVKKKIKQLLINIDGWKIIFLNGYFISTLSSSNLGPYKIYKMNQTIQFPKPIINDNFFLFLIESLAIQPILIYLEDNQKIKKPLYILNITSGSNEIYNISSSHYRYHFKIGKNSQSHIIEYYISLNKKPHLTGSRSTSNIGNNSYFNHIKLINENNQSSHFTHNDIISGYNSNIKNINIFLSSSFIHHHSSIKLNGSNCKLLLNSLSLSKYKNIINHNVYLEHNYSFCNSKQLHKAITLNKSKFFFNGIIKVTSKAIKTNGKMINNNLLLGKEAEINTKPQLEIYADNVKCSHSATVGNIDDEQLFYLCSRGISIKHAKNMIIIAFATEIIDLLDNQWMNTKIMDIIQKILTGI